MIEKRTLNTLLLQFTLGTSLVFIPTAMTASALEPAPIFLETSGDAEDDAEPSNFESREALAIILFGENQDINAAKDEISAIEDEISAKEAEITALDPEATDYAAQLATLEADLVILQGDLVLKTTALDDLIIAFITPLENLTDEQVFAMNRSFNGWVNNAFDVSLSAELIDRLLSGDLNDKQIMFAIRAEFEQAKFNQLGDKMLDKGLADQEARMRARGETQKEKFDGKVEDFAAEEATISATSDAMAMAKSTAKAEAKNSAKNASKGQAKAEAKQAAKDEAKKNAKNVGRGHN